MGAFWARVVTSLRRHLYGSRKLGVMRAIRASAGRRLSHRKAGICNNSRGAKLAGNPMIGAGTGAYGKRKSMDRTDYYSPGPSVRRCGLPVRALENAPLARSIFED